MYGQPQPQVDPQIYQYFQMVDTSRSGWIDINELQQALKIDNSTPFRLETCKIMLDMFDHQNCGQINPQQFEELWKYIANWRRTFTGYDTNKNGRLEAQEATNCIRGMGYQMPDEFIQLCLKKFDLDRAGSFRFDDFVRIGIFIQSVHKGFHKHDPQNSGTAWLTFEKLLELALLSTGTDPKPRATPQQMNPYAMMQQPMMMQQQMPMVINITVNNTNINYNNGGEPDSEGEENEEDVAKEIYARPYIKTDNGEEGRVICVDAEVPEEGSSILAPAYGSEEFENRCYFFQMKEVCKDEWAIFVKNKDTDGLKAITIFSDLSTIGASGNFDPTGEIQTCNWTGFPNQRWQLEEACEKAESENTFLYYIRSMLKGNVALNIDDNVLVSQQFKTSVSKFDLAFTRRRPFTMMRNTNDVINNSNGRSYIRTRSGRTIMPTGGDVSKGNTIHTHPQTYTAAYDLFLVPVDGDDWQGLDTPAGYMLQMGDFVIQARAAGSTAVEFELTDDIDGTQEDRIFDLQNVDNGLGEVRFNARCNGAGGFLGLVEDNIGGWAGKSKVHFLRQMQLSGARGRAVDWSGAIEDPVYEWGSSESVSTDAYHYNIECMKLKLPGHEHDGKYLKDIYEG